MIDTLCVLDALTIDVIHEIAMMLANPEVHDGCVGFMRVVAAYPRFARHVSTHQHYYRLLTYSSCYNNENSISMLCGRFHGCRRIDNREFCLISRYKYGRLHSESVPSYLMLSTHTMKSKWYKDGLLHGHPAIQVVTDKGITQRWFHNGVEYYPCEYWITPEVKRYLTKITVVVGGVILGYLIAKYRA